MNLPSSPTPLLSKRIGDPALLDPGAFVARSSGLFPLYGDPAYPKEFRANMDFRTDIIRQGYEDPEFARDLWILCKRDPLFWLNTFCWTFDPRRIDIQTELPFISYPCQDDAFMEIKAAIGHHDLAIVKSRDMGVTWLALFAIQHECQFEDMRTGLLVSIKEELVDKTDDPDCLFWKLDFSIRFQPSWLLRGSDRLSRHIGFAHTGSTIDGQSTTGDVGRGGRRTVVFPDEYSSIKEDKKVMQATRDNTKCRILPGTPKGMTNDFAKKVHNSTTRTLWMHWSLHPEKARGMYTSKAGKLVRLETDFRGRVWVADQPYTFPDNYPFILDGKVRSPWYDDQCARADDPLEIAQEADMDFLGSTYHFFPNDLVDKLMEYFSRPPLVEGELEFDDRTGEVVRFAPVPGGRLRMWVNLDEQGRPPAGRDYGVAADVGAGTGASLSTIAIGDLTLNEYVGEWACAHTNPEAFATCFTAIRRWLANGKRPARAIWERNGGPGAQFSKKLLELEPNEVWIDDGRNSRTGDASAIPGFWSDGKTKGPLFGDLRHALNHDEWIIPSVPTIEEMRQYKYKPGGIPVHAGAITDDPTAANDAHGDRVVAAALLYRLCKPQSSQEDRQPVAREGSLKYYEEQEQARGDDRDSWIGVCEWEGAAA